MSEELYVRGVVIANGIPDSDGDVLNKKDIRTLLTKFEHQTDTMHTYIKNEGVEVIENWINETPTLVNGQSVPAGSWLATTKITNENLIENISNGKLNSFSLGSVPLELLGEKGWFISKAERVTYSDVLDLENVKPLFISFVDMGANGFTFEVLSYEAYINKNMRKEDIKMSEKEIETTNDSVSISGLTKFLQALGINKNTADAVVEPTVEAPAPAVEADNTELIQNIREEVTAGIVEGFEKIQEKAEAVKEEVEAEIEKEEPPKEEEEAEEEVEAKTDVPKIDKRETTKTENVEVPQVDTNFYKLSGRDMYGCKIRK